nr:MAG TPA: hypothetical protein [Crassvirales sp.]
MNIPTLKEKMLDSLDTWLKGRVDEMVNDNPALSLPSVYIKRGCHNILNKYEGKISQSIDNAALFLADENGDINTNTLFTDAMEIFKGLEDNTFDIGLVQGVVGKGRISITLPDNIFTNIIFGNKKTITFNENDFLELKSLFVE